jgi:hypothetical protein
MTTWADQFNTYAEACEFYGADTPAGLRAEEAYRAEEEAEEARRFIGPVVPFDCGFVVSAKLYASREAYFAAQGF